jgi:hypothetical protein
VAADDYAIVVGIATYPFLDSLSGPVNDAKDFRKWLVDPAGGNVPRANVKTVFSSRRAPRPGAVPEPTVVPIDAACEDIIRRAEQSGGRGGRRLYLYFAGHGIAPKRNDALLMMANAAKRVPGHHIAGSRYAEWFRDSAFFDEVVMFMDCCQERYPRVTVRDPPFEANPGQRPSRHFYAYATEWSRATREGPFGGAGAVRGLFTLALLAGLRTADRNERGQLTGAMLQAFVLNWIQDRAREFFGAPVDEPDFDYKPRKDIVFVEGPGPIAATGWTVRARLTPMNAGKRVTLVDGELQEIPPARSTSRLWEWMDLRDGLYRLRLDGVSADPIELLGTGGTHVVTL